MVAKIRFTWSRTFDHQYVGDGTDAASLCPRGDLNPHLLHLRTIPGAHAYRLRYDRLKFKCAMCRLGHATAEGILHRTQHRSRWQRLAPGRQALLALAHLANGDTHARLAAGFAVDVATAWRYMREAITLLAAVAEDLATAMRRIRQLAYAILVLQRHFACLRW